MILYVYIKTLLNIAFDLCLSWKFIYICFLPSSILFLCCWWNVTLFIVDHRILLKLTWMLLRLLHRCQMLPCLLLYDCVHLHVSPTLTNCFWSLHFCILVIYSCLDYFPSPWLLFTLFMLLWPLPWPQPSPLLLHLIHNMWVRVADFLLALRTYTRTYCSCYSNS